MWDRINLDRSPQIDIKKMIRPREITLALIAKLALVKSVQTLNSFRLKNHFSRKKMIRPQELTLIAKLALVKLVQMSNSFRLKNHFSFQRGERSELIRSDFCTCP